MSMKESDLYLPLKQYLQAQNYEVKAEINECDVVAVREDEAPVIVELKLTLNLDVILQCVDRLSLTSKVYIGIPKECKSYKKRRKQTIKMLKMLGLGLIVIDTTSSTSIDVVMDPSEYTPRKSKHKQERLLKEFEKRVGDPNLGGMAKRKGVLTSYRQKALKIAQYLEEHGATKASVLAKAITEPKARDIMYDNHYGWFDKLSLGVYDLSPRGKNEIQEWLKREEV